MELALSVARRGKSFCKGAHGAPSEVPGPQGKVAACLAGPRRPPPHATCETAHPGLRLEPGKALPGPWLEKPGPQTSLLYPPSPFLSSSQPGSLSDF